MNKRDVEMDMLRGLAITAVILIHITAGKRVFLNGETDIIFLFINQISRFAVPVFLFLSGMGLALSSKKENYSTFILNRVSKIIPWYLMWSLIYFVLDNFIIYQEKFSVFNLVKDVLTGSAYYHLYYVPLIIIFYLIFPLINKYAKNNTVIIYFLFFSVISQLSDELFKVTITKNPLNIFNWLIYFGLGIWFANYYGTVKPILKNNYKRILSAFIIVFFGITFEAYLYANELNFSAENSTTSMRPSIIIFTIIFILLIISIRWSNNHIVVGLTYLSKLSYGIYLSHAFFLTAWNVFYSRFGLPQNSTLQLISSFVFVMFFSIVATNIMNLVIKKVSKHNIAAVSKNE